MFNSIADVPGFFHAATFEEAGSTVVNIYAAMAVDLQDDEIAAPLRDYLAGRCHAVLEHAEHDEPMFLDGRGRSMKLAMLDTCPGEAVPHVCSVGQR